MWLPFYYKEGLKFSADEAGFLSATFELGGLVGTPLIGYARRPPAQPRGFPPLTLLSSPGRRSYVSDRYLHGRRDLAAAIFMGGASSALLLAAAAGPLGKAANGACMAAVGVLVIGPDSVLSGTIAQDIGLKNGLGPQGVGAVAGLMNGIGSLGAIFQSPATAYISSEFGWRPLFYVFSMCAAVSSAILFYVCKNRRGSEIAIGGALCLMLLLEMF